MPRLFAVFCLGWLMFFLGCQLPQHKNAVIYRDDYGIPNIYAESPEAACFAAGYAQAEDRLEELLRQYRRATGTMAEAFGEEYVRDDFRARLFQHAAISERRYHEIPAAIRALLEAFLAGAQLYMERHPETVPEWAPNLDPSMIVALSRHIIWGWPAGSAAGDLARAGIQLDPIEPRGSNQWAVSGSRTASGHPIALIDPHLGWYGQFRFYEMRVYGGDLALAGVAILGLPLPSLGHNRFLSVAMTTGGPDTSDVFEIEFDPNRPQRYLFDGESLPMRIRHEEIKVRQSDGSVRAQTFTIESTHHGPIVARKDGKGYAMKLPYADEVGLIEQTYDLMRAENLRQAKAALSKLQLMEQNVMIATVDGDIYYVRNGRVPIRPAGFDWQRPVPGNTSATEWLGIHPLSDLVQLENPPQGYMQNCNVPPTVMLSDSPMQPEKYSENPYLFNAEHPYLHQRAAQTRLELENETSLTLDEAIEIAHSTKVYNAEVWQERLVRAVNEHGSESLSTDAEQLLQTIQDWDGRLDRSSVGGLAYYHWKELVYEISEDCPPSLRLLDETTLGQSALNHDRAGILPPPISAAALVSALEGAAGAMRKQYDTVEKPFGDVFRIKRRGSPHHYPIGGGSLPGLATPRALSFGDLEGGHRFARGGQTATQIVVLSNPPKSYSLLPLGQSDDPTSPHYCDQAERIMQPRRLKPTYFLNKRELMKNVTVTTTLTWLQRLPRPGSDSVTANNGAGDERIDW